MNENLVFTYFRLRPAAKRHVKAEIILASVDSCLSLCGLVMNHLVVQGAGQCFKGETKRLMGNFNKFVMFNCWYLLF